MTDPIVFSGRHRVAVACGATLGETPMWDPRTATLYWVDIKEQNLWRWRPDGGEAVRRGFDAPVAFVKLTPDPEVVVIGLGLALVRHHLGRDTTETVLRLDGERPGNRLNDAGVGPDGSLYLGTMDDGESEPMGSFYRWSPAGLVRFGERAVVTNGPTVDGVRRIVYTADTQAGRVFRHALGTDGVPGEPEPFVTFAPGWGHPDGLTVDAEGHVWICHWGGARVTRFSPAGEPVFEVPLPTAQITKVAFGGPDLATMYVTSAAIGRDRETDLQAGHVFAVETGIRGLPPELCRMPP